MEPRARVVYVDNDPIVLAHARALLTSTAEGRTAYLEADLREPERILASPELRETLDLNEPVALSLFAILHFVPDEQDPDGIVARLLEALRPGSYLALNHATPDFVAPEVATQVSAVYRAQGIPFQARSHGEISRFLDGLNLAEPGLVPVHQWWPTGEPADIPRSDIASYGALARLP